ncbi:MAG: hypothetical protein IIA78_03680 [Proteobacteria bacterium]|nr:hypothetical protein [Pseudomonadota bacterium]
MPVLLHKHYLFGSVFALVLCAPVAADNEEAIAHCAKIASVGDRVLCLEAALRQSSGSSQQTAQTERAELPEFDDEVLTTVPEVSTVDSMPAPVADAHKEVPEVTLENAATSTVAASSGAVAGTVEGANSQQPELGAEQVSKRDGSEENDPARIGANIIAHELVLTGRLRLTLDNGQVWRQLDSRSLQLKENSVVLIRAASLGSFLLEKLPGSRSIRVKRID